MKVVKARYVSIFVLLAVPCAAQDARQDLSKWIMTYYMNPTPEKFVDQVKAMASAGILFDARPNARPDANAMFLGKIMEANAASSTDWLDALTTAPLSDEEANLVRRAAWYSGTKEALEWLKKNGAAELAEGPRPLLLSNSNAMRLEPHHLDQYWEWFFATGEAEPVLRIVALLSLAHDVPKPGSLELLPPPQRSNDKRSNAVQAYNYRLLKPALWSMTSLAIQHDRVLAILKETQRTQKNPRVKAWLERVIAIAEVQRRQKPSSRD